MAVPGKKESRELSSFSHSIASDEDVLVYCQPCDEEGPRLQAHGYCTDCKEHLCRACFTFHKKHKLSKHHKLLNATSMPKALQQPSPSNQTNLHDQLTTPCLKHAKEIIKFYCHYHKELLCSVCVTLKHTDKSCKIDYIPDISEGFIHGKECEAKVKVINTITKRYEKVTEDLKAMAAKSNMSLAQVKKDIQMFRNEVNQELDELEKQVDDEVVATQQQNENYLKTVEASCADAINSLKSSSDAIKQLSASNQADKLFVELKLADDLIEGSERNINNLQCNEVKEYDFSPNKAILNLIKSSKSIGTLVDKYVSMETRNYVYQGKINVKMSKDKDECQITGMILLSPDVLIIADQGNRSVKLIDTNHQSVADHLIFDSRPRDITKVYSSEMAVTFPFLQTVQFISTSSSKLTKKRMIVVDGDCHGISCHQDKLVVSFYNPPKLQILDLNGNILTTIKGKHDVLKNPLHVTCDRKSIFVSDWGMKSLMVLTWQGEVTGRYGNMEYPSGLAMTDKGTILVCDNERNVIEEISKDCSSGNVLLEGLKSPYVVCWCAETKKVYYCCLTLNEKEDSFIKIHTLS